jgi:hypothetical protein
MNNPDPDHRDPAEVELLRLAQAGDLDAFAELCGRLRPALLRFAGSLPQPAGDADGEDLAQEAFLRLFLDRARLRDVNHFRRRAFETVKHLAWDRAKIFKNHRTDPLPESFEEIGTPLAGTENDGDLAWPVSLPYALNEMKPLTKALGQPSHNIARWMLDAFAANGGFPTVREIAAHWRIGHGSAEAYRTRILTAWRRHPDLYGLNVDPPREELGQEERRREGRVPPRPGNPSSGQP